MCGIAGVSINSTKNTVGHAAALFKSLVDENTIRGKDSTGIVYQYKNSTEVYKGLLSGTIAQEFLLPAQDVIGFLGHTRYATVGDKTNYDNIHPFETDKYVGVHNGTIFNHKLLKSHFKLETKGECDSEIVYRLLDKFGIEGLKFVEGTYLLAYIEKSSPDEIRLITNGSKPMLLFKLHGELVGFGSIGENTQERAIAYWDKFKKGKYSFEDIKPCTLYRLKEGKIIERRDLSSKIKYMSLEEGKLRYKVDYKILKKDFYQMALPMKRRLAAPKPATTVVTPSTKKRTAWGGTYGQRGLYGDDNKHIIADADPNMVAWVTENLNNSFDMLTARMCSPVEGVETVYMNVDTLGMCIPFGDASSANSFINREMFNIEYGQEPEENQKLVNPMVTCLPQKEHDHQVWLPFLVQSQQLFNAMIYADRTVLYTTRGWTGGLPEAPALLAACLCNSRNKAELEQIRDCIDKELVMNSLLDREILDLTYPDVKRAFQEEAKSSTTIVYSKKCPLGAPYISKHFVGKSWFNPKAAEASIDRDDYAAALLTVEDLCGMGRGYFVSEVLTRLCELVATNSSRIYPPKSKVHYNKLDEVAKRLFRAFKRSEYKPIQEFMSKALDLKSPAFTTEISHDLDTFEAAFKEQVKCYFSNTYLSGSPMFYDLPRFLNKYNVEGQVGDTFSKMIIRTRMLHDFVVEGTVPVVDEENNTLTLKETK